MEIALYSNDPELHTLCRDIVRLTPGARFTPMLEIQTPPSPPTDICIYDTTLGSIQEVPDQNGLGSVILIVSQPELQHIRTKMLHLRALILLRPVNRARLEIAIEQSLSQPRYTVDCDLLRLNRDELLECLLDANLRLQEYDQDRSHFLARAIHELRAPLTSLNGYCGLLLDRKLGPLSNEQINVLLRVRRSIERLGRIVSTMFDLSVGRSCEHKPDYRIGNILECLDQALHEVEPALRDRKIELAIRLVPPAGELCFDQQHLEQVFLNLLDNCCRFAGKRGLIRISGYPFFWERRVNNGSYGADRRRSRSRAQTHNSYRIDIADNGPGIQPGQLERIFGESATYVGGLDRSGAGLGLAVARMLVNEHNGRIWAESNDRTGTTFCVVIPYYVEPEPAPCQGWALSR